MSRGRRVAIIGVVDPLGRRARAPARARSRGRATSPAIDSLPPPVELQRTDFIEADMRSAVLSRLLPATEVDTVVHCGILWYPEPGTPGARAARDQRDRHPPAARRLRAHRPRCGRWSCAAPRRSTAARRRCRRSSPRTSPRRSRCAPASSVTSRELEEYFRQLRPPPPAPRLLHAALPARDRTRARQPAGPLPDAPGRADAARATTRGCSSCTPTTPPGRSRPRSRPRSAAPSTSLRRDRSR